MVQAPLGAHKLPRILLANCSNDGWADLHGPTFKAASTKATARFFESLCKRYFAAATPKDRNVCAIASSLVEFHPGTL